MRRRKRSRKDRREIVVHKYTVRHLWTLIENGCFAVPEIQREFVWDIKKAARLLDSMYKELPIGSLLVWRTHVSRHDLLRHAQEVLPAFNDRNQEIWFLIDGQQRLSVLHRARAGGKVMNYNDREVNFDQLCFWFERSYETRFLRVPNPVRGLHVPVVKILAHNWRTKLSYLPKGKLAEVEKCRRILTNYQLPVIFLKTRQLDEVRESFLRINSGGLRIGAADRAFTRASRLNLRHLVGELRSRLPHEFSLIDRSVIQFAAALIRGERDVGGRAVENALRRWEVEEIEHGKVSKDFSREWHKVEGCVEKAVDYLTNELRVPNPSFLPSDNMLATLAYFFHANNGAKPNSAQKRELRKWFWATAVASRYAGRGYRQNVLGDVEYFTALGRRRKGRFVFRDLVAKSELKRADYLVASGLTTAFFLLLSQREPLSLENASRVRLGDYASVTNRKDKHHVFPKALLTGHGFSPKEANSMLNICYMVADENQSFGRNKPVVYLERFRHRKHFARVMRSHYLPYDGESGLWDTRVRAAYRKFRDSRLRLICRRFESEAGMRLFRDD